MASLGVVADSATNRVRGVDAQSFGASLGVIVGDMILEVNSIPVGPNELAYTLQNAESIDTVLVVRDGNRVQLSTSNKPAVVGKYTSGPNHEEPWADYGRVVLGQQVIKQSMDVESSGSLLSGFGPVGIVLAVFLSALVMIFVNLWVGLVLLLLGCTLGGMAMSFGKHISLQAKTARFLVKDSLNDGDA